MKIILSAICMLLLCSCPIIARSQQIETIWFKNNSSTIDAKYLPLLNRIGEKFVSDDDAHLKIYAYTDTIGSTQHNSWLAEQRAMNVLQYLVRNYHIDTGRVYAMWIGEDTDIAYDLHFPQAKLQQRCVDILACFPNIVKKQKAVIDKQIRQFAGNKVSEKKIVIPNDSTLDGIQYHIATAKNNVMKITRKFSLKDETKQQTFFLKNDTLFYATESITSYFDNGATLDSIRWAGDFYFSGNKLIDFITLGHGKSETEEWQPGKEMLSILHQALKDIKRYIHKP